MSINQKGRDKFGMSTCIGELFAGMPYPVFFDPHYPATHENKPPVTTITGSPGSGKTFFGLTLAAHASILGKIGFILDPKGDFIALKSLERAGEINQVQIWSVINADGKIEDENIGMLDPVSFTSDPSENTALTLDIIKILVGDLTSKQVTILTPIIQDVTKSENDASFANVVRKLRQSREVEAQGLGATLDMILSQELAKLLVSNKRIKKRGINIDKGFIVANLMGLKLPPDTKIQTDYDFKEKISVCIMGLLSQLILDIMKRKPPKLYKTLIIDEAWTIFATKSGRDMIAQILRLGRSRNMAAILISQSPKHFEIGGIGDVDTMVSTRFAFRNNGSDDNKITCEAMKLPENEGWEELIPELETGKCLMQDCRRNTSFVHVMAQDNWIDIFNTNPVKELEKARKQ